MAGSVWSGEGEETNQSQFRFLMLDMCTRRALGGVSSLNTSSFYRHSPAPVLLSVVRTPPFPLPLPSPSVVCGCMRVCHSSGLLLSSLKKKQKKKTAGHWFVLQSGPDLSAGAGPGGSSSVIQDDLDKTGHVCVFGVMHGEERVFLHEKERVNG